jgi:hypothetical protein
MITKLDAWRATNLLIRRHGAGASLRRGWQIWARIRLAIEALQASRRGDLMSQLQPDDQDHPLDPLAYYNPEANLFPALAERFAGTGELRGSELYLILDWKAPRARTRHLRRLVGKANTLDTAARQIGRDLREAIGPEQRMGLLLTKWGFRLPTASTILAVLYPDTFTVYDLRVCTVLRDFHQIADMKWSREMWSRYQGFVATVRAAAKSGLSLRDCDRWLWGKNKRAVMRAEVERVERAAATSEV